MHCYVCLVDGGGEHQPACAICQRCGAALCEKHLVTHISTSPMGLGASGNPRYQLVCQRCSRDGGGAIQSTQRSVSPDQPKPMSRWSWRQLTQRKQLNFPDPHEAIADVEAFLKKQRKKREK